MRPPRIDTQAEEYEAGPEERWIPGAGSEGRSYGAVEGAPEPAGRPFSLVCSQIANHT